MVDDGVADAIFFIVLPAKVTVPLLWLNVPSFVKLPFTVMIPEYEVKVLPVFIVRLLKEKVGVPLVVMAVVPPKVAVLFPALSIPVPLTARSPLTVYAALGVSVVPVLITTILKFLVPAPVKVVTPALEKVVVDEEE